MSSQPICKLCQVKIANQTGSHILSHALISICVNQEGIKGRDKELMFGISQSGNTELFVGKDINPDKIEEVKGRPISDEEIKLNKNGLVRDNIFCTDCEKLFGKVESSFSSTLKNIRTKSILKVDSNIQLRLYFIIQAWRASASRYNDWSLNSNLEEKFRILIFKGCSQLENGIDEAIVAELLSIPMIITFLETPANDKSSNIVLITDNSDPYLIFLCDFILQFFEPQPSVNEFLLKPFLNLNTVEAHKPVNFKENTFLIGFLKNDERLNLMYRVNFEFMVAPALKGFIEKFILFCKNYGQEVNDFMIKQFVTILVHEKNVPLYFRYSDERIELIAQKLTGPT